MNNVASIKDRLKNKSRETGKTLQELFTLYGLERTIYRLSISRYRENFVLKGGIFLYALYQGEYPRSTTDIDLLAQRISKLPWPMAMRKTNMGIIGPGTTGTVLIVPKQNEKGRP